MTSRRRRRIAADIPVDLPRPRIRTSPEFNTLESKGLDLLDEGPNCN